jgi:hypothetical protein
VDDESQPCDHAYETQSVGRKRAARAEGREKVRERDHDDSDEQQAELAPATLFDPRSYCEGLHDFTVASGL